MSLESDLYGYLKGHAGLKLLVGERVYPAPLPQGAALPAVTYTRVSTVVGYSHSGESKLDQARIQLDCWAETHAGAIAVAAQVRAALSGRISGLGVCFLDQDRDIYEPETGYRRRLMEVMIWREES